MSNIKHVQEALHLIYPKYVQYGPNYVFIKVPQDQAAVCDDIIHMLKKMAKALSVNLTLLGFNNEAEAYGLPLDIGYIYELKENESNEN